MESNVKKVQRLVGGTVGELLVKEGAHGSAGDILDGAQSRGGGFAAKAQNGVVQDFSVHARGSAVGAGEQIMLIVPESDALVVEVRIPPQDIDQVQLNQAVTLCFPNFNQRTTPELSGTVIRIAPDVTKDGKTGSAYYLVRIKMSAERLGADMKFVSDMPVDVFIRTQDRTLLSYLVKPLIDQAARVSREMTP